MKLNVISYDDGFDSSVDCLTFTRTLSQCFRGKTHIEFYNYFDVLHGKELSYNNIVDLIAAVELVNELDPISCAIIKHTNAAGAASGDNVLDSYLKALSGDPVSSFGGIVAFNTKVNKETAEKLNDIFLEIIVAPDFENDALEILKMKKNYNHN